MAAQWTFMVYMAGNNSLSGAAIEDLGEMRKVGSTADVQILAFIKQRGAAGARRIKVTRNGHGEEEESLGNVDSGDPQTLIDFIRWGVQTAPAERYAVVLWNHGGGWTPDDFAQLYSQARLSTGVNRHELNRRSNQTMARLFFQPSILEILKQPTEGERQICNDDGSGHSLDMLELGQVLRLAVNEIGHPIDVLGLDACLMSNLEVAYEVREQAHVIVGSEDLEPGAGWCYTEILTDLTRNPEMTPADLGRTVVQRYVESYRNKRDQWPVTQAAVDTNRVAQLTGAVNGLEQALRPVIGVRWAGIFQAQVRAVHFENELVDLATFCRNLQSCVTDAGVRMAAQKVMDALRPGGYVLAEGHLGTPVKDCAGVSCYLPNPTRQVSRYYRDLQFAKDHNWDRFLSNYMRAVRGG